MHGTYKLVYDAAVDVEGGVLLDLHVRAQALARTVSDAPWQVELLLSEVKVESETQREPVARAQFVKELSRLVRVQLDEHGAVTALSAQPGTSEFGLRVFKTIVAAVQVVEAKAAGSSWQTQERDPVGTYTAQYTRGAAGIVDKVKQRYDSIAAALPTNMPQVGAAGGAQLSTEIVESRGAFRLKQRGIASAQVSEQTQVMDAGAIFQGMKSQSTVSLFQTSDAADFSQIQVSDATWLSSALDAQPKTEARTNSLDYVKIAGRDVSDFLTLLRRAPDDDAHRLERRELFVGLDALLRTDPGAVKHVVGRILAGDAEAGWLLDALAGCGGSAAQSAIVDLLHTRKLGVDLERRLLSDLTIMRAPTPALTATLEGLIGDPDLGRFALFASGAHADYVQHSDGARTDHLLARFESGYAAATTTAQRADYLTAMGNAANAKSLPTLESAYQSAEPSLRSAALNAMRAISDGRVDVRLAAALINDPSGTVRAEAARALRERAPTQGAIDALTQSATSEADAATRLAVLKTMQQWLPRAPSLAAPIAELQARNQQDSTR